MKRHNDIIHFSNNLAKLGHVMQWPWIKCINLIFTEFSCIHHQVKSCRAEGLSILYLETLYKQSKTSLKWKCVILQQQTHTSKLYMYNTWSAQKQFATIYATIKYGVVKLVGPKSNLVWFLSTWIVLFSLLHQQLRL